VKGSQEGSEDENEQGGFQPDSLVPIFWVAVPAPQLVGVDGNGLMERRGLDVGMGGERPVDVVGFVFHGVVRKRWERVGVSASNVAHDALSPPRGLWGVARPLA